MHGAPSVSYPVGRSSFCGCLLLTLGAAGGAVSAVWWWQATADAWRPACGTLAWLAACAWAMRWWWCTPATTLVWDGQAWQLEGVTPAGTVGVALDLQRALLLDWRSPAGRRWLWLDRTSLPTRWADLRRAVYSPAAPDAPPGPVPPSAHS